RNINSSLARSFIKKGWLGGQPRMLTHGGKRRAQSFANYLPAAAAAASTFTLICFGLASSRFGIVSVNAPFLYSALIASLFTVLASEKLLLNEPYVRSTRR